MTSPAALSLSAIFPDAARAASPSVVTIVLLIVIVAGALALVWDLAVSRSGRSSRSGTGPPAGPGREEA